MKRKLNDHDVPEAASTDASNDTRAPKMAFTSFGLDARLLQAVNRAKFAAPTAVQTTAIPVILDGKDVLARSKTGSGKTLAYLLPILHSILLRKASSRSGQQTSILILVPTKELANQVTSTIKSFTTFCANEIRAENITRKEDDAVTRSRLAEKPDIVVSTPSRASQWLNDEALKLESLNKVVIDEADLVLSYGYSTDLDNLASAFPPGVQIILLSATLNTDINILATLLSKNKSGAATEPIVLDLSSSEAAETSQLSHYVVRTAEEDKFLLIYAIFKLKLIKGKVIVFVADIDRCYRVKLFLEQFGIRSCVLNSELPLNSRVHVVEEFNKGVYDVIVAADEEEVFDGEKKGRKRQRVEQGGGDQKLEEMGDGDEEEDEVEEPSNIADKSQKASKRPKNAEYTLSRGIDFHHVSCVLNFDLPASSKSYLHRVGRTARAGQTGMALSFYVPKELYRKHKPTTIPQCQNDEHVLTDIKEDVAKAGGANAELKEWQFDMKKLEGFRYRFVDALRSVTRIAVREARTRELRNELLASEKLKRHFEENPGDLQHLRHDNELSHGVRQRAHLRHVPEYLLPDGGKAAMARDIGYVGLRKDGHNGIRERRRKNVAKGKGKKGSARAADPIKSLNMRGRGKK